MKLCYSFCIGDGHGHYDIHSGSDGLVFDKKYVTCKRCLNTRNRTARPMNYNDVVLDALKKYKETIRKKA